MAISIDDTDYDRIEDGLQDTPLGRAFLRERDRRARGAAVSELRDLREEIANQLRGAANSIRTEASTGHLTVLRRELQEMGSYIEQTRKEIANLRPADAGSSRIMAATGELDAIVSATERATSDILNAAERLVDIAEKVKAAGLGTLALEIEGHSTDILMACSFQDITGQRTTKVVNTLRYIEQRVLSMIEIWGVDGVAPSDEQASASHRKAGDTRPDAHLLNGPALGDGIDQSAIDAMMAGFGPPPVPAAAAPTVTASAAAPPPAPARAPAPPPAASSSSPNSQADIDALFG